MSLHCFRAVSHTHSVALVVDTVVMPQKKHARHGSDRIVKGAVAPISSIRRTEIVEVVVDNLRPWHIDDPTHATFVPRCFAPLLAIVAAQELR